jgi:DNA-binding NarL/FixJ family response regulator
MKRARVLLADDHRIVAEGLRGLLEPEFELVGIVEDGRALLDSIEKLRPDVVVVDISMPLLNGIEAVRRLKKKNKDIAVVFLTMHLDVTYAASAFEAGASGYVLKHSAPSELIAAISSALKGRTYITPLLAGELLQFHKQKPPEESDKGDKLTMRATRGATVAR